MTASRRYPARYFDGKTARPQTVSIRLAADGISIFRDGGVLLAAWPPERIVLAERPRTGDPIRIGLEGNTARLVVEDASAVPELLDIAPRAMRKMQTSRRSILKVGAWSVGAIAAVITLVLVLIPVLSEQLASRMPETLERNIGKATLEQIVEILPRLPGENRRIRYCTQAAGQRHLRALSDHLLSGSDNPPTLQLIVIDANLVNAFALPGGYIIVTQGLLYAAESPEEIAGILAHEIGHVVHDHPSQAIFRATAVSLLISAVIGDFTGGVLIAAFSEWILNSAYTRSAEREADAFAIERLNAINMDGGGLERFFERVQKETDDSDEKSVTRFLSTHPPTAERLQLIRSRTRGSGKAMSQNAWKELKDICGDGPGSPSPAGS